jgi:hypothetical protein
MKIHTRGGEVLVAACDADLIGRTLRDGELRLHVSSFYDGDDVTEEDFIRQLKLATIGNLVGSETVEAARKAGLVGKDGILWIDGVPHAQLFVIGVAEQS